MTTHYTLNHRQASSDALRPLLSTTMATVEEHSLLAKLDSVAPLAQFDAFPKLPSTYKARSESRGFMTLFVAILAVLLVLNDIGEYIWGWSDYEFSVDNNKTPFLNINLDMVVAMPCGCEWVSLLFCPFGLWVCMELCWDKIGDTSPGETSVYAYSPERLVSGEK